MMMKKYLIRSAIVWSIYLMACFGICVFWWQETHGIVILQMAPSFAIFLYNVYANIKFFRKYRWSV
jgi:hypothetical protein